MAPQTNGMQHIFRGRTIVIFNAVFLHSYLEQFNRFQRLPSDLHAADGSIEETEEEELHDSTQTRD